MKPYGIPKAVLKGYDKGSEMLIGKIGKGKNKRLARQVWKGKARQKGKAELKVE